MEIANIRAHKVISDASFFFKFNKITLICTDL